MANQMIALGIKPVQLPDLGAATARMSNVMANMAVAKEKQAGIQRANAFRQLVSSPQFDPSNPEHIKAAQSLDPAGTEKIISGYDSRQKAQLERLGEQTQQYRDILVTIDPADKESYAQFRADVVAAVPGWGKFLPTPEQWGPEARLRTLMKAQNVIDKTIPTPTATPQQDINGYWYESRVGGLGPKGMFPLDTYEKAPPRKGTVSVGPSQTVEPGVGGPLEAAPMMPGAKSPRLSADLASPLLNVRDEASYQQALQMIGTVNPDAANQLRQIMPQFDPARMEGIREAAFAEFEKVPQPSQGLVAGERGGVGGPYETVDGFVNTGRPFRGKPPLQSPAPGTNIQTLPRIAGEAGAAEGGKQNVRVNTEPKIAGGTKAAELRAQRDDDYPDATFRMRSNLARVDAIIEQAQALRRHPAYRRIIGPIDAFTPNLTAGAQEAQSLFETLAGMGKIDELQKMRAESKTGGAVGNASDADIKLLGDAFGSLRQAQGEEGFDASLLAVINRAKQTRDRIIAAYRDTYNYRLPQNWSPPAVSKTRPQPKRGGTRVGEFIVTETE